MDPNHVESGYSEAKIYSNNVGSAYPEGSTTHPALATSYPRFRANICTSLPNLVLRILGFLLSLLAFALMLGNNSYNYSYRGESSLEYLIAINILACLYSIVQGVCIIISVVNKRSLLQTPFVEYLSFVGDQVTAYLLLSCSSSAATRVEVFKRQSVCGDFCPQAQGSISMSFLAFGVVCCSALQSGYHLSKYIGDI